MLMTEEGIRWLKKYNHFLMELSFGYYEQGLPEDERAFIIFKVADEIMEGEEI